MTERGLWASCLLALMLIALVCTLHHYRIESPTTATVATSAGQVQQASPVSPAPETATAAAPTPTPAPTVAAPAASAATSALSPSLRADYGAGVVTLLGVVPDQATKNGILDRARSLYGAQNVVDKIVVKETSRPEWFAKLAPKFPPELRGVELASVYSKDDGSLAIDGKVGSEADKNSAANALSQAFGADIKLDNRLAVAAAATAAAAGLPAGADTSAASAASAAVLYDLGSVYFRTNSALLSVKAKAKLRAIAKAVKNGQSDAKYSVAGFTDSRGTAEVNLKLSERRAKAVATFLQKQGVDQEQLSVEANGSAQPAGDNATVDGRAANRRVEVRLL